MWLALAFVSAALLGLYDVAKKRALLNNAVLPVLLLNTLFSTILFSPLIAASATNASWFDNTVLAIHGGDIRLHGAVMIKAIIVLASWVFGYIGIKHLPLTIAGPIHATRPVITLVGAMIIFGERLNLYQWIGVMLAIASVFMLGRSSRKEGVDFKSNVWVLYVALAAFIGACSGIYDRYLMTFAEPMFVQAWYTFYQLILMSITVALLWLPQRGQRGDKFHWSWAIPLISLFLSCADVAYLYALSNPDAMISVVSMIRRSSVIVSFSCGALLFHEKNLRSKSFDLLLILIGMIFLYIGSR